MNNVFTELKTQELHDINGGKNVVGGIFNIVVGSVAASVAVVAAISVPVTGAAGASVAVAAATAATGCFRDVKDDLY